VKLNGYEFALLRDYIHDLCGLDLQENKKYLIEQRIEPVVRAEGCLNYSQFYQLLKQNPSSLLQEQIINAITTNETSFFRDHHPYFFGFKEYILPRLCEFIRDRKSRPTPRKGPKVRIWSAGASTGQEPYSIAILIQEYLAANREMGISAEDFCILASDISSKTLSKAMTGAYNTAEKDPIPPAYAETFFRREGQNWHISDRIRSMVEFRQVNLARPFAMLGGFDVIFCRNVLIYFDNSTKSRVLDQFYDMLFDQGFLVLGATENVYGLTRKFESTHYQGTLIYRKVLP
jgi:chemotaxis protein methyltransferase CheR